MSTKIQQNKRLGARINRDIWNDKKFEKIPEYFTEDFVADYSPRIVRNGRDQIEKMVLSAHDTFENFRETVHHIVADESQVVLHFTISGRQVKDWGPIPATNKPVQYDEIVIMQIREGKVYRQVGVADTLLALQQLGRIPDPGGYTENSFSNGE